MWLSLVEHYVRDVGAAGSNPVIPTKTQNRINAENPVFMRFFFIFLICENSLVFVKNALSR